MRSQFMAFNWVEGAFEQSAKDGRLHLVPITLTCFDQ